MAGMMVDLGVEGFGFLVVHGASSLDSADIEGGEPSALGWDRVHEKEPVGQQTGGVGQDGGGRQDI